MMLDAALHNPAGASYANKVVSGHSPFVCYLETVGRSSIVHSRAEKTLNANVLLRLGLCAV